MSIPSSPPADLLAWLGTHRVFGRLDVQARAELAARLTRQALQPGSVCDAQTLRERLGLVLQGTIALAHGEADETPVLLGAGDLFGAGAGPHDASGAWSAVARDAAEVAFLPAADVTSLLAEQPAMTMFLAPIASAGSERGSDPHLSLMTTPVRALIKRAPITCHPPPASCRPRRRCATSACRRCC
jgi:CBS domain-containing protein